MGFIYPGDYSIKVLYNGNITDEPKFDILPPDNQKRVSRVQQLASDIGYLQTNTKQYAACRNRTAAHYRR